MKHLQIYETYLNKYKIREMGLVKSISDNELPYIKEVLLDLNDEGIKTGVSLGTGHGTRGYPNVLVVISDYKVSDKDSVEDCLSHIKSYMLSNDWTIWDERGYSSDDLFNDDVEITRTYSIMFKRSKDLNNI